MKRDERYENICLENYEWDSTWIEQTKNKDALRIFYIGDSISNVARGYATRHSENTMLFDGLGTSKAVDNPYFYDTVRLFADQQRERCAILFNSGLHGPHLTNEEYKEHYEKFILFLLKEFENTPLILLLSTAQTDPCRNERVIKRNEAVLELADKHGLSVIDLYSVTKSNPQLISADGIHMLPEGYSLLGKEIVAGVKRILDI